MVKSSPFNAAKLRESKIASTDFHIEKIKSIKALATFPSGDNLELDFRRATIGLCDVVLELLVAEKRRS